MTRRAALLLAGGAVAATLARPPQASAQEPATLSIQPRSVWAGDSRPAVGDLEPEDVQFLLVHHTASQIGAEPIGVMRGVYQFHTGPEKGWPDVAYNFFIDQFGTVYEARTGSLDGPVTASATGGNQGFAQLVCLLGDFTDENPTEEALASLALTLAWLADRDGVDTTQGATTSFLSRGSNLWPADEVVVADTISGHRDMSRTACPGDTFYPNLKSDMSGRVAALRAASGGVQLVPAAPTTVAAPVTTSDSATTTAAPTEPAVNTTAVPPSSTTTTSTSSTSTSTTAAPTTTSSTTTTTLVDVATTPVPGTGAGSVDESSTTGGNEESGGSWRLPLGVVAAGLVVGGAATVAVGVRSGKSPNADTTPDGVPPDR